MTIKLSIQYLVMFLVMCLTTSAYTATFCVNNAATLSNALNIADNNLQSDEIRLQAGVYTGNFIYNANVAENGNLVIRGGFNAACTASSGNPNDTVLDGNGVARTFVLSGRDNSNLVVSTVTIRGGLGQTQGAGADIDRWLSATVSNSVFVNNNTAAGLDGSGGMEIDRTLSVNVMGNVFVENHGGDGGGLSLSDMRNANISRNQFINNTAMFGGGALDISTQGTVTMANNLFDTNSSVEDGGAISLKIESLAVASSSQATNNTFVGNTATGQGGAVDLKMINDASTATFHNNIYWNNSAARGNDLNIDNDDEQNGVASPVFLEFNDFNHTFFVGFFSTLPIAIPASNFNLVDPQFVNPVVGDYHLNAASTLINAGDSSAPAIGSEDLDGAPRVQGPGIDLGSYELGADTDNDGVRDANDNCTLIANTDQRDTNSDGFGNVCDPDLDNNGIVNFGDVSLWVPFFNTATNGDADFNGDGFANFGDYSLFPAFFQQPPGPSGIAP